MLQNHSMNARASRGDLDETGPRGAVGGSGGATDQDRLRWEAVIHRDRSRDVRFVYAVTTTSVFCRPTCPSRRPRRDRVRFFDSASQAVAAGFRACKRCRPTDEGWVAVTTEAVSRVARYLERHVDEAVPLSRLAGVAGLSASHLQRVFTRTLGVSPRQFQAACRAGRFRQALRSGRDVTASLYEAGYGSPSRVYESMPTGRGMAPATYRRGGLGAEVGFTAVRCSLGWLLVASTAHGVCAVKLGDMRSDLEAELRRELPLASISADRPANAAWVEAVLQQVDGPGAAGPRHAAALPLDIRGTAFQWRVWRALQRIPRGETRTYADVAAAIGEPTAVRAVARACATNPVGLIVACHRVVPKAHARDGNPGGYRWGAGRKRRLLANESGGQSGGQGTKNESLVGVGGRRTRRPLRIRLS
jgi:AraC family transcriptional regulator of adaptative response/methylated-DNA-[protein]-cysteine methyltransferase